MGKDLPKDFIFQKSRIRDIPVITPSFTIHNDNNQDWTPGCGRFVNFGAPLALPAPKKQEKDYFKYIKVMTGEKALFGDQMEYFSSTEKKSEWINLHVGCIITDKMNVRRRIDSNTRSYDYKSEGD